MKQRAVLAPCAALLMALAPSAWAGPGEDPVVLLNKVQYLQMPTAPAVRSQNIQYDRGMPDDMQAKIARYSAQAFVPNPVGIATEKDVVQSVKTNGTQVTCVQSLASTPASSTNVTTAGDRVVVIRGDMINICN